MLNLIFNKFNLVVIETFNFRIFSFQFLFILKSRNKFKCFLFFFLLITATFLKFFFQKTLMNILINILRLTQKI